MLQRMLLVNRVKTHVAVGWTRESGFCLCYLSYKPGRSRSSSRSWEERSCAAAASLPSDDARRLSPTLAVKE